MHPQIIWVIDILFFILVLVYQFSYNQGNEAEVAGIVILPAGIGVTVCRVDVLPERKSQWKK